MYSRILHAACAVTAIAVLAGCASGGRNVPYAFIQADELEGTFYAGLPGTRIKGLSGDFRSGRFSSLLLLPGQWSWNTGASPGKTVEIYVLRGEIILGDLTLRPGNYAWLPQGSTGLTMSTESGAQLLYFQDDANRDAVIQTPLFMSRDVVPWQPLSDDPMLAGIQVKELRFDPGSGARTYLLKIEPGASQRWQRSSAVTEGFLLSGSWRHSECLNGKVVTGDYAPGGYFQRPAEALHGGPEVRGGGDAVWFMRARVREDISYADACLPAN